jgi:hypothetical protein
MAVTKVDSIEVFGEDIVLVKGDPINGVTITLVDGTVYNLDSDAYGDFVIRKSKEDE